MDRPVSLDDRAVPPIALGTCICANPSRSEPTVAWSPTCNWPRTSGTLRSAAPRPAFCVTSGVPTMPPLQSACADLPRAFCAAARPRESSPRTATGAWSAPGPTATSIRLKRCGSGWASARSSLSRRRRGGWASMSSARCSRWWPTVFQAVLLRAVAARGRQDRRHASAVAAAPVPGDGFPGGEQGGHRAGDLLSRR